MTFAHFTHTFLLIQLTHRHRHSLLHTHKHNEYKEKQLLSKKKKKLKWTSAVLMYVYSMPVLTRASYQRLSYLKRICIHMYGNSHQHEPDQNEKGLQFKRYVKKEKKKLDSYVCAFSFIFFFLFFAYILISKQKQEGKCKYSTILSRFAYQLCNKCNPTPPPFFLPPDSCISFIVFFFQTP